MQYFIKQIHKIRILVAQGPGQGPEGCLLLPIEGVYIRLEARIDCCCPLMPSATQWPCTMMIMTHRELMRSNKALWPAAQLVPSVSMQLGLHNCMSCVYIKQHADWILDRLTPTCQHADTGNPIHFQSCRCFSSPLIAGLASLPCSTAAGSMTPHP